eukprot:Gb_24269 [translate_table: standard]
MTYGRCLGPGHGNKTLQVAKIRAIRGWSTYMHVCNCKCSIGWFAFALWRKRSKEYGLVGDNVEVHCYDVLTNKWENCHLLVLHMLPLLARLLGSSWRCCSDLPSGGCCRHELPISEALGFIATQRSWVLPIASLKDIDILPKCVANHTTLIPAVEEKPLMFPSLLAVIVEPDRAAFSSFPTVAVHRLLTSCSQTPPDGTVLVESEQCLKALAALDQSTGMLMLVGVAMPLYPINPHHSRMLLTVVQTVKYWEDCARANLVLAFAISIAAALRMDNPFLRQFGIDTGGDAPVLDRANEDALLKASADGQKKQMKKTTIAEKETGENNFVNEAGASHGKYVELAWRESMEKSLTSTEEDLLGEAVCAGWADRVAQRPSLHKTSKASLESHRPKAVKYEACAVEENVLLHHKSSVARLAPEYVVYNELVHTSRPYMHVVTNEIFCWVHPTFGPHLWELPLHKTPMMSGKHRIAVFACALLAGKVLPCLKTVQSFLAADPCVMLKPETAAQKRGSKLLHKLSVGPIVVDSRRKLNFVWDADPKYMYYEILPWLQSKFHPHFKELWEQIKHEA